MKTRIAMIGSLLVLLTTGTARSATCGECNELNAIVKEYKQQMSSETPAYAKLEAKAVGVVQRMTAKTKILTADRLNSYFDVLRLATPVDPGAVFIEDTIEVIRANRKAIDAKIKKLPSQEARALEDRIEAYTANAESGPD